MLERLVVSNLAVVERAEVDFGPGLNVITGETGAGKSVLMGALSLVLGGRADSDVVREGAKEAEVEATFGEHAVRRTVTVAGRTRAWIDDESVSIAELKVFGEGLVDIHGPRANQRLLDEDFQRAALDAFGDIARSGEMKRYQAAYDEYVAARAAQQELAATEGDADAVDLLTYQVGELEGAALSSDDETLAARHAAAAHAGEIVENANAVTEALGGDESVASLLASVRPRLRAMARHLPAAEQWADEAEDLTVRAEELSRTVADAVSALGAGEEDLDALDARLTVVNRLKRKYLGAGAPDEGFVEALLDLLEKKRARLDQLAHREERLAEAAARVAAAEKDVRAAGAALTKKRKAAAERLAKGVTRELRDLGFLQAKFSVALAAGEIAPHGLDRADYRFEPNPGEGSRSLAAVASSGEIARVMLALKGVLAAHDATPTLVFDEIDANIGGEVGSVVGAKLAAVAAGHQVIAITHLPQSAVYGARHLTVAKRVAGGRTHTEIAEVAGAARAKEIARMLGGERSTSVALRHAEELLENAERKRKG